MNSPDMNSPAVDGMPQDPRYSVVQGDNVGLLPEALSPNKGRGDGHGGNDRV